MLCGQVLTRHRRQISCGVVFKNHWMSKCFLGLFFVFYQFT
jgi:hypothetical protein